MTTHDVNTENDAGDADICRVCRCEGTTDRPLFYPCLCHGSIRFVHDDCLIQWLKISRKEECELCGTKFRFTPIYHPSMPPGRLPIKDLINGLLRTFFKALKYWLHYLIVAFCWLGIVPITASRIYRCLFAGSVASLLTLPYDIVSTDHLISDVLQGGLVVFCSLGAFICLLWLREQILTGGGPAWLQAAEPEPARPAGPVIVIPGPPPPAPAAAALALPPIAPAVEPDEAADAPALVEEADVDQTQNASNHAGGIAFADVAIMPDQHDEADDDGDEEDDDDDDDDDAEEDHANAIPAAAAAHAGNAANQEHNHNWIDWDRAADDLTWERLLGLDGSLQFVEHVFWVVTLNTLFIFVFAYTPYHLGKIITTSETFRQAVDKTQFVAPINTLTAYGCVNALIGYISISFLLLFVFTILSFVNYLNRLRRLVGLAYIVLKVALLVILEILLFPFICGLWLDVCSLRILNERTVTINDRLLQFQTSPGTSTFLHWLCGMVFVFYFATFIFLLREVLRPGALWFLKSMNDMDFNPIQEMIQLPLALHLRRFATSIIIFGCVIILMFFAPGELLIRCIPKFLPFNVKGSLETVVSELMIEFILLQGILPTLLEQGHTRTMLKYLLHLWVELASWLLGLRSFLLGDTPNTNTPVDQNDNVLPLVPVDEAGQDAPAPPAQAPPPNPAVAQPFTEPPLFRLRLAGLCVFTCISLAILSILGLTIPAAIGRNLLGMITGSAKLHELYTILTGLYILWLITRIIAFIRSLLPFDIENMLSRLKTYSILCLRVVMCTFCVIGYVPFMIGLVSELVLIIPLSTSIEQTAVLTPLRVWIIGLLNTKIAIALVMSGPQWRLKTVLERLYQDGLRRIDFVFLVHEFLLPFTINIGMFMAFPYLAVSYLAPFFFNAMVLHQIERYIYTAIISVMLLLAFVIFQMKQLRLLFEHVRDEKYLVGRRLINFER